MAKVFPITRWINYFVECSQIPYWAYFKPFTFKRSLSNLNPHLNANDNLLILLKSSILYKSPELTSYAGKIFTLTIAIPFLTIFFFAPVYTLLTGQAFDWLSNFLFLISWLISLLLVCKWFYRAVLITIVISLVASFCLIFTPVDIKLLLLPVIWGTAIGSISAIISDVRFSVVFGVGLGVGSIVAWSMLHNSVLGAVFGTTSGMLLGAASGLALGLAWVDVSGVRDGINSGVIWGILSGIALSLISGLNWGFAWGLAFVLGVLRFYFWLPELVWVLLLFLLSRSKSKADLLKYLPPCFDELIILPLPFISQIIIEVYPQNPDIVRQMINYLMYSTNQKQVAIDAMIGIAIETFNQCQTKSDIATIADQLAWMNSSQLSELGTLLPQFLQVSQAVKISEEAYSIYLQEELLDTPIKSLQELRNRLKRRNISTINSLSRVAERWLKILGVRC